MVSSLSSPSGPSSSPSVTPLVYVIPTADCVMVQCNTQTQRDINGDAQITTGQEQTRGCEVAQGFDMNNGDASLVKSNGGNPNGNGHWEKIATGQLVDVYCASSSPMPTPPATPTLSSTASATPAPSPSPSQPTPSSIASPISSGAPTPPALTNPRNPVSYGADPTGVNDSAAAFQSAINTGDLHVLAGTYLINTPTTGNDGVRVPSGRNILCDHGTVLKMTNTNTFNMFRWPGTNGPSTVYGCQFRGHDYNVGSGKTATSNQQTFLWIGSYNTNTGLFHIANNDFNGYVGYIAAILTLADTACKLCAPTAIIENNTFENCGHYAVQLTAAAKTVIQNNTLHDCNGMAESASTSDLMSNNLITNNMSVYTHGTSWAQNSAGQGRWGNYFTGGSSCSGIACDFSGNTVTNNHVSGTIGCALDETAVGGAQNDAHYTGNSVSGSCSCYFDGSSCQ